MTQVLVRVVDVYVYRKIAEQNLEFLLFRRARGVAYAGSWRMVGGKIGADETAWAAARREVEEETGRKPLCLWSIPSVNAFYEWKQDRINLIPAFAAQLEEDPLLNHEHDAFAWLSEAEAARRLAWPEQQRLLRLAAHLLTEDLPSVLVISL